MLARFAGQEPALRAGVPRPASQQNAALRWLALRAPDDPACEVFAHHDEGLEETAEAERRLGIRLPSD